VARRQRHPHRKDQALRAEIGVPHRLAMPREAWTRFFGSARREIDILAYSALFLAQDRGILRLLAGKGHAGVNIRVALRDPRSSDAARRDVDMEDAAPAKIREALTLFRPAAEPENVGIRLHQAVLYNSIYRADDQLIVNQHAYGVPAAQAPVFRLRDIGGGEMTALYRDSFQRVWASAVPLA
jgi:hypothetical protein